MPSVSDKQRAKMYSLYKQGKITKAQWEKYKVVRPKRKKK